MMTRLERTRDLSAWTRRAWYRGAAVHVRLVFAASAARERKDERVVNSLLLSVEVDARGAFQERAVVSPRARVMTSTSENGDGGENDNMRRSWRHPHGREPARSEHGGAARA